MDCRLSNRTKLSAKVVLVAATIAAIGCAGANPFLSAQFANSISVFRGATGAPVSPPSVGDDGTNTDGTTLSSVCDLPNNQQVINVSIENEAVAQQVQFNITFVVSAGTGGFVCDDQVADYTASGYTDAFAAGSANSIDIGCETVTLAGGNRILTQEFGFNSADIIPQRGSSDVDAPTVILAGSLNGDANIPLPELIVFGSSDPNFQCIPPDLCTQRGFVYLNTSDVVTGKSVDADHIQGTLCNEGFGTAPEWRLDKTLNDNIVQAFQFPPGGTIVVTVLDRASDTLTNTRNQVVWLVTNSGGQTVHNPDP